MSSNLLRSDRHMAVPSRSDSDLARDAGLVLKRAIGKQPGLRLHVELEGTEPDGATFVLPEVAARLLLHILDETAHGNAVVLVPLNAELTTQQAADMLNVSRPHLVSLVEAGRIRHHKVGTHRRIRMMDLVSYREAAEAERQQALDDLAAETRELGLDQ